MEYKINIIPYTLHFKNPAGTSRGVYLTRKVWYVVITSPSAPGQYGIGECAPLPELSCDDRSDYEQILTNACKLLIMNGTLDLEYLRPYPSILFGFEGALRHFHAHRIALWNTPFSRGEQGITINGLIWMGEYREMLSRIEEKMKLGYCCIKLKIGAINFEEELTLLKHIRSRFKVEEIELRVDANGAFAAEDALEKLKRLSELDIHSIEQPIRAGQWEKMARLTEVTPLPIALDEELIGCNDTSGKKKLLATINPQYIILKPSLHGGLAGCNEWIEGAEANGTGWWVTSALESNIGLNVIAQWCGTLKNTLPQGLGTGLLYTNNITMPLSIKGDQLWFDPSGEQNIMLPGNEPLFS